MSDYMIQLTEEKAIELNVGLPVDVGHGRLYRLYDGTFLCILHTDGSTRYYMPSEVSVLKAVAMDIYEWDAKQE